jgi:hypothetical protein
MFKQFAILYSVVFASLLVVASTAMAQSKDGCLDLVDSQQNATGAAVCIAPNEDGTKTVSLLNENGEVDQSFMVATATRPGCRAVSEGTCTADERPVCLKKAPPKSIVKCIRFGCCKKSHSD